MKKAVAIRIYGDEDMGSEMANVLAEPIRSKELEEARAEVGRLRGCEAENGVRKRRDAKYFKYKIRKANRKYAVRPPCKAAQMAILAWAMTWLAILECYNRLSAWNRS